MLLTELNGDRERERERENIDDALGNLRERMDTLMRSLKSVQADYRALARVAAVGKVVLPETAAVDALSRIIVDIADALGQIEASFK